MKFSHWRAALEVSRQNLNVTESAKHLFVSQSVISKQIRALEAELGVQIFERSGKRFVGITRAGQKLLKMAGDLMDNAHNIERAAREFSGDSGAIRLAATHFELVNFLPKVFHRFKTAQHQVELILQEGTANQIAPWVLSGEVDFGILATPTLDVSGLVALPFLEIPLILIAAADFKGIQKDNFKIENLSNLPLILPHISLDLRDKINKVFQYYDLKPKVVLDALNTETMKVWVLEHLGVAIVPENVLNEYEKEKFKIINISAIFPKLQARILIRRGAFLRRPDYSFIQLFAPHLTMHIIDSALNGEGKDHFL